VLLLLLKSVLAAATAAEAVTGRPTAGGSEQTCNKMIWAVSVTVGIPKNELNKGTNEHEKEI
jgi:hypothetical protein